MEISQWPPSFCRWGHRDAHPLVTKGIEMRFPPQNGEKCRAYGARAVSFVHKTSTEILDKATEKLQNS